MENSGDNFNAAATTSSIVSVENLNNVANWVSATVISAFFSSLERFSCVNVATMDPDEDDDEVFVLIVYTLWKCFLDGNGKSN
ncbi:PROTEIN putative-RELATED [Salix viminalis]|uniref:PROTEIN putative-RELATED n=1 Tax=Salix viminalis TaxID=40686 RepID=A0A9Q0YY06_SALVM|nr:PROTEIN putative-RELATED [Salix viminalis]